jgi:hypothetical protein
MVDAELRWIDMSAYEPHDNVCKPPRAEVAGWLTNVRFGGTQTALPATGLGRKPNSCSGWNSVSQLSGGNAGKRT